MVNVLNSMTVQLLEQKSLRLLKHIIRCYLRLADNKKALEGLRQLLPAPLKGGVFDELIREDPPTVKFYSELLAAVNADH